MANELDEMTGPVNGAGRDINVIEKQLPARVGWGSTLFEIVLWCLFIIPGLIFLFMKIGAKNYFQKLQQKIQADASTIDNYLEQRVQILKNLAKLVEKAVDLDKDVMKAVAAFRGGRPDRRMLRKAVPAGRGVSRPQGPRRHRRCDPAEQLSPEGDHRGAAAVQRFRDAVERRPLRLAHQADRRRAGGIYDPYPVHGVRRGQVPG